MREHCTCAQFVALLDTCMLTVMDLSPLPAHGHLVHQWVVRLCPWNCGFGSRGGVSLTMPMTHAAACCCCFCCCCFCCSCRCFRLQAVGVAADLDALSDHVGRLLLPLLLLLLPPTLNPKAVGVAADLDALSCLIMLAAACCYCCCYPYCSCYCCCCCRTVGCWCCCC
jgi:hypothetical protein